jgi:hypothetical protein
MQWADTVGCPKAAGAVPLADRLVDRPTTLEILDEVEEAAECLRR